MAVLQKVKINNEWVPVSGSNINSGDGGISEEKEVYIGADEPTDDGAKLWIDPTGTPSSPSQPSDYATKEYVDNAIYNVLNSSF